MYFKEKTKYLQQALDSIIQQSVLPTEIVLVEDGPIDVSLEKIIVKYKIIFLKHKIDFRIYRFKSNQGLGKALNYGVKKCRYNLIARMDTDDICSDCRFEKQIQFMSTHPDITVVGSDVLEFSDDSANVYYKKMPQKNIKEFSKLRNPLCHPSVMFRKNDIISVGSYQQCPKYEDYYLWIKLLVKGFKVYNIGLPLVQMRANSDQYLRRGGISYIQNTLYFIKLVQNTGYFDKLDIISFMSSRVVTAILPNKMLAYLYKKKLREKIDE
ncbi:glycosyltransferase [Pediococcus cellicola]|uniref:Glycosyltransferase n=1 Tax=Pediococcus cellicola TaxID=319652 RepID=A0A0R2IW93_9LACO|nr:glycosyltransferase [Pediococcus cellicola]